MTKSNAPKKNVLTIIDAINCSNPLYSIEPIAILNAKKASPSGRMYFRSTTYIAICSPRKRSDGKR